MTYGAQFLNDAGGILLDTELQNYSLYASGTATTTGGAGSLKHIYVSMPTIPIETINSVLVFIRTTSGILLKEVTDTEGVTFYSQSPCTFEYRIYTVSRPTDTSGYGINIYDSSGLPIFSSNQNLLMKVSGIVPITDLVSSSTALLVYTGIYNPFICLNTSTFNIGNYYTDLYYVTLTAVLGRVRQPGDTVVLPSDFNVHTKIIVME